MSTTEDAYEKHNDDLTASQQKIVDQCQKVQDLLLAKNERYGDSALNPSRIFSSASPVEQILVRIDDKLSRISRGAGLSGPDEDTCLDLTGYLILLQIAVAEESEKKSVTEDLSYSVHYDDVVRFTNADQKFYPVDRWDTSVYINDQRTSSD